MQMHQRWVSNVPLKTCPCNNNIGGQDSVCSQYLPVVLQTTLSVVSLALGEQVVITLSLCTVVLLVDRGKIASPVVHGMGEDEEKSRKEKRDREMDRQKWNKISKSESNNRLIIYLNMDLQVVYFYFPFFYRY